jgi:hypothetical protein
MRIETVVEILRALPGVRVHWQEIERGRAEPTTLKVELSVDERPERDELVITVRPGDRPHGAFSLTSCARCGAPGRYLHTKYCDPCRAERRAGLR